MGKRLNGAVFDAAKTSVEICIGLIGLMALWLGLLNVAKDAGLSTRSPGLCGRSCAGCFPKCPTDIRRKARCS